jgi:hypothetical protein
VSGRRREGYFNWRGRELKRKRRHSWWVRWRGKQEIRRRGFRRVELESRRSRL